MFTDQYAAGLSLFQQKALQGRVIAIPLNDLDVAGRISIGGIQASASRGGRRGKGALTIYRKRAKRNGDPACHHGHAAGWSCHGKQPPMAEHAQCQIG